MSDYSVYVAFLDKAVDIEKKNRKHIFGVVKAAGNTALLLENIVLEDESDNGAYGKVYYKKGKDADLYEVIRASKSPFQTINYENIWTCKPVLSKEEKAKRYGLPEDTEEQSA